MQGVWIGTLYKLLAITVIDGCHSPVVPGGGAKNLVVSGEKTMHIKSLQYCLDVISLV